MSTTATIDSIKLTKEERERARKADNAKLTQLKAELKQVWLHGKAQRLEAGHLLLLLRQQVEHGQWGTTLKELGIPPQTARDYMEEAATADQIHGIRGNDEPDAETVAMEEAVADAQAEVNGDRPAPQPKPQLENHNRVKGPYLYCTAEQKDAYKVALKENKERVYQIFYDALMEVIGEQKPLTVVIAEREGVADESLAA